MKEFFLDIFEYHHHFNRLLIGQVELQEAILPKRTFELLCHVLNASQIWNSRILAYPALGVHQLHSFSDCLRINDAILDDVRNILDHHNLDKIIRYRNTSGMEFNNSVREILYHSVNHAAHHKGQIISDFRVSGIAPLVTDYILYKRASPPR